MIFTAGRRDFAERDFFSDFFCAGSSFHAVSITIQSSNSHSVSAIVEKKTDKVRYVLEQVD